MSSIVDRDVWVARVLGIQTGRAEPMNPPQAGLRGANVAFQQARLLWDSSRRSAHDQLGQIQKSIFADFAGEPAFAEIKVITQRLDRLLEGLDERLSDKLDEALNADASEKGRIRGEAIQIVDEYHAVLESHPGITLLDDNPFTPVQIRKSFSDALAILSDKLRA